MISVADQTKSLLQDTKILLEQREPLTLREIAEGSAVELEWLRKFHGGHIERPNIERVERVYRYLSDFKAAKRFESREARA